MADFVNTVVPILIILAFALFMWYKLREPLSRFWEWFSGMMSSGKEKTVQTVQTTKEIVYDI
jgi:hypothetical protein